MQAVSDRRHVESRDVLGAERVTHDQVMQAIRGAQPQLLRSAVLFDVFRPQPERAGQPGQLAAGEKSLAIRLTLASDTAALQDVEIDAAVQAVLQRLAEQTGARLR